MDLRPGRPSVPILLPRFVVIIDIQYLRRPGTHLKIESTCSPQRSEILETLSPDSRTTMRQYKTSHDITDHHPISKCPTAGSASYCTLIKSF